MWESRRTTEKTGAGQWDEVLGGGIREKSSRFRREVGDDTVVAALAGGPSGQRAEQGRVEAGRVCVAWVWLGRPNGEGSCGPTRERRERAEAGRLGPKAESREREKGRRFLFFSFFSEFSNPIFKRF